jgi:hypothetical protein
VFEMALLVYVRRSKSFRLGFLGRFGEEKTRLEVAIRAESTVRQSRVVVSVLEGLYAERSLL